MSATLERPKVPAEYRGLARVFRDKVFAVDAKMNRALPPIIRPLLTRVRRHPRLRDEQIATAMKLYRRDVPAAFRIGTIEVHPDRARFSIAETRLTASWMNNTEWDSNAEEPGIAVARCVIELRDGRLSGVWIPYALVSAHALGRWFERTGWRDHAALVHDLAVLAHSDDEGERVATPHGGHWRGEMLMMQGTDKQTARARSVRTWVGD